MSVRSARKHDGALSLSVCVAANGFLLLVGWGIYQYNNEEYIRRSQNFFWLRLQRGAI